jgi:molybdopterin/thiamine biosynthesis adenylyltransferase
MTLSKAEHERYQRQLIVESWDQERLKRARVLIVGVGGLGGIIATYLAAAGVGNIRICDSDKVELSNLNRQIMFSTENIGHSKVAISIKKLSSLSPDVKIETYDYKLTGDNVTEIALGCDIIMDGLDNHQGRLILNQASFDLKIPYIYGAINDWQGQISFFNPPKTPCLACVMPNHMLGPSPIPVFGALPGIIGSMQATIAIRYLMTGETPLAGKLLIFNADRMEFEEVEIARDPKCEVCGGSDDNSPK